MNELVIVASDDSVGKCRLCIDCFGEFFQDVRISVLSSEKCFQGLDRDVSHIDEKALLDRDDFRETFARIAGHDSTRYRWYYQQFLKLYCHRMFDSSYVIWDCDTFPLTHIDFTDEDGNYLFNIKTEHHTPYFTTMRKLIPDIKLYDGSFISEYMVFDCSIVRELIDVVRGRGDGQFHEIVLKSVNRFDLDYSGFSEYETYGNYMYTFHNGIQRYLNLNTNRHGRRLFPDSIPSVDEIRRYCGTYDTITIENW